MADEANEELDSTNQETEEVLNTEEVEETVADTDTEDTDKLRESNKRLFERAKKAEALVKELKSKPEAKSINTQTESVASDELRLIARGLSDEEIEQAKAIAKGKGVPLMESLKDPMFQAYQKDLREQEKKEKAKLGASKGSGQADPEKGFTPDIHKPIDEQTDEHKDAWKKALGK